MKQKHLDFISEHNGNMSVTQIAAQLKIKEKLVRQALKGLRAKKNAPGPAAPTAPAGTTVADNPSASFRVLSLLVIALVGFAVYLNSLQVPFIYDDFSSIPDNPYIRQLWPLWNVFQTPPQATISWRPIVSLTLALNYALSGIEVWSYHLVNILIHLGTSLTLLGLLQRVLPNTPLATRYGPALKWIPLFAALIFVTHPIQTESVTYIVQRAESLMGLFYLLSLYCFARGAYGKRSSLWFGGSVLACFVGMATKQVTLTAPIMILLFDWAFVARGFAGIKKRAAYYAALIGTYSMLFLLSLIYPKIETWGFDTQGITPFAYAQTQCGVLLHYLRLCLVPHPLVLNYEWPIAKQWGEWVPQGLCLISILGASLVTWFKRPQLGYLAAWFFIILGPTSSFMPIVSEVAAEHRLYLPLAAIAVGIVLGCFEISRFLVAKKGVPQPLFIKFALVILAVYISGLSVATIRRNAVYKSEVSLWKDNIKKRPDNIGAYNDVGAYLTKEGKFDEALIYLEKALEINPQYWRTKSNLGILYHRLGDKAASTRYLEEALSLRPDSVPALKNLAGMYAGDHDYETSLKYYQMALALEPFSARLTYLVGQTLALLNRHTEAIDHFLKVEKMDPDLLDARDLYEHLAVVYLKTGDKQKALHAFQKNVSHNASSATAWTNLGSAHMRLNQANEAVRAHQKALSFNPKLSQAYFNLGLALARQGKKGEAKKVLTQYLVLEPNSQEGRQLLASIDG